MTVTLLPGDCIARLATLAENSIDSIVTDPPYHFNSIVKRFGKEGAAAAQFGTDGAFARTSRGFMGKEWDGGDIAFRPETWEAALRVLKPGGHLLAFGSSKGFHRMAVAIEDAGFEIRDTIMWLYGTGFPKSLDVAKAIDKSRKEDVPHIRAVCRFVRAAMDARKLRSVDLTQYFGDCNPRLIDHWAARDTDSQPALPTPEQWARLKWVLGLPPFMDEEVARLNARKGEAGDAWNEAEVIGEHSSITQGLVGKRFQVRDNLIRQPSAEAAAWEGWGTALKPAFEPVVMARKELDGTVAANVLEWGTGAINIDGCRILDGTETRGEKPTYAANYGNAVFGKGMGGGAHENTNGRWPANVLHDGSREVLAAFPGGLDIPFRESSSRFFYCAKASTAERAGSKHPTVKPIALMRYLVRMVTPPGGTVLDMFAGSGTTGQAAREEGFNAILIEREAEYQADIRRRLGLEAPTPSFAEFMAKQEAPSFAEFMADKT